MDSKGRYWESRNKNLAFNARGATFGIYVESMISMRKLNGVSSHGVAHKRIQENVGAAKQSLGPMFETTRFPNRTRGERQNWDDEESQAELKGKRPATSRYVSEFHPLSYLYTVVQGNFADDCDEDGNPRMPTAIPGVLNRKLGNEYSAKIRKLNREIEDIQKRIGDIKEKVDYLNKIQRSNDIYLLLRNVSMWMTRMETKEKLIDRIEDSMEILDALQDIDENCNATMFWLYACWRKIQHPIGPNGSNEDWDNDLGKNEAKYDKYQCDSPEIIRIFKNYEAAYRRNIEISKLYIKEDLIRSRCDEKLSRFLDDNYTRCKGCRAMFSRRYDDLFGTRIHCPSRVKARENHLSRGDLGKEDGSNLIVCFFCTDCFDVFNPSIIKKMKRDKELKIEKDLLEMLIEEDQQEQADSSKNNSKSSKKKKKKKRKKNKKSVNNNTSTNDGHDKFSAEDHQSDTEQEPFGRSYDEDEKSANDSDEKENRVIKPWPLDDCNGGAKSEDLDKASDSSTNDIWVDFLLKTGSIIELNAFMDETIGKEKIC